jgi:hypothetical protein
MLKYVIWNQTREINILRECKIDPVFEEYNQLLNLRQYDSELL